MKPLRSFGFCVWMIATCLLLGGFGCKRDETAAGNSGEPAPYRPAGYFKTPFQTEAQFVIENITTDIAEMIYFAKKESLPDAKALAVDASESGGTPDAPTYDVTVRLGTSSPVHTAVTLSGPIWSEQVYAKLTAAIARAVGLRSPSSTPTKDTAMIGSLTDGQAATVEQATLELS